MKNKFYYLFGAGLSSVGDGIQQISAMWLIYQLTGSSLSIGMMIAIYYLPSLFLTPFLSVYSDHRDSKRLCVMIDMMRFVMIGLFSALILSGYHSALLLYILQGILAVCYMLYKPASQTLIKEAFASKDLAFVISKASSINSTATILGSGLAGILLSAYSPGICFMINAASFLVSAWCNHSLRRREKRIVPAGKIDYRSDLQAGWNFVIQKQGMVYLLFLSIISSASLQMSTAILLPYANQLGGSSGLYSLFDISFTTGGILSGLLVDKLLEKWKQKIVMASMGGMLLLSLANAFTSQAWSAIASLFGLGFFTMMHLVAMQTLIQLNTPKELIGRVVGLRTIIASLTKVSASLGTGYFIHVVGIQHVFLGFGILVLLAFLTIRKTATIRVPIQL